MLFSKEILENLKKVVLDNDSIFLGELDIVYPNVARWALIIDFTFKQPLTILCITFDKDICLSDIVKRLSTMGLIGRSANGVIYYKIFDINHCACVNFGYDKGGFEMSMPWRVPDETKCRFPNMTIIL